jgi:signal transduction histidine kinase
VANLVDNAIRHNVPGGRVWVDTATADGRARITVRNTGPVVAADEVDGLFRPFQRLGGERVGRGDGHGLGLAIVRAIADAHSAVLAARARPDGGLDIQVTFP